MSIGAYWQDGQAGGTPLKAVNLNARETAIVAAARGAGTIVAAGNLGASYTLTVADSPTWMTGTLNAGTCALTVSGLAAGDEIALFVTQDGTGGRILTIDDGGGAVSVGVDLTAGASTTIAGEYDGSTLYLSNGRLASTDLTDSASLARLTSVQTLTNKRVTSRVVTVTQSATPAINTDNTDVASITGLAQAITSMTTNLSGTPADGDTLLIRLTDDGTGRAISWGAKFEASTIELPTTTVASTMLAVQFIWNTVSSAWRCVGVA